MYYKAKDGKLFQDPLECQEYEKNLGVIPNSVADIINVLEEMNPNDYVNATMILKEPDGTKTILCYDTICCDLKMNPYVNVEDLDIEQRCFIYTFTDIINWLKKYDKDCPVQYMIVFSSDITMKNTGIMANNNPNVWSKIQK